MPTSSRRTNTEPAIRRRILLVEDDGDLREALTDALAARDVEVVAVDDGREGLRRMREIAPDAVVLDLMMPGMDGWQFRLEQKRDPELAETPVVAISASHSAVAKAVDADRFLQKPCTAGAILEAVEEVVQARQRRAEPARAAQADRMAALGTLAAGVAHEINNPLTYMLIHLTHALRMLPTFTDVADPRDAKQLEALISGALEGAERIRDITRRIRTFSRAEDDIREPVDVASALDSALAMIGNELRHKARLVREVGAMPRVLGDEGRLAQVFLNLLSNALQALPDGAPGDNEIRVATTTDDQGRAVVTIADTGPGIAPHHLPHIFEPFFTTKPIGEGTGLGLWISHGIVTAMGGAIEVQSGTGRGATFRIILPPDVTPVQAAPPPVARRVLVIDSDQATADAARLAVAAGDEVVVASSAHRAVELVLGGEFDLILCDVRAAGLTGPALYRRLRGTRPRLASRMVFLAGAGLDAADRAFLEEPGRRVLTKPIDEAVVRRALDEDKDA